MIPSTLFSWAELHWQQYQGTFFRWDYHKTADYSFLRACNIKSRACNIKPWTCNIKPRACNIKPRACNIKSRACNITWYILTRAWYIRVRASYIKSRTCNLRPELATLKTRTCNLTERNLQPYGTEVHNILLFFWLRIPVDTRSLIPVISVHSISNLQYRWQS